MMMTIAPAYWVYEVPVATDEQLAKITKEADRIMGALSSTHSAYLKLAEQQQLDKKSGYGVIRALCSPQLNFLLAIDAADQTTHLNYSP